MNNPKISARDLNFYYGKFHALKNINLDIQKNKVTAFIGPSGCGKSTLLRTFNRMYELYPEQRATGQILMDNQNILQSTQDVALLRAKVGMVFQKPTPFPMSIYDNIAFGFRLHDVIGRTALELGIWVNPQERADMIAIMNERGSVDSFEVHHRAQDGRASGYGGGQVLEDVGREVGNEL